MQLQDNIATLTYAANPFPGSNSFVLQQTSSHLALPAPRAEGPLSTDAASDFLQRAPPLGSWAEQCAVAELGRLTPAALGLPPCNWRTACTDHHWGRG
jgi:hypothetical protein